MHPGLNNINEVSEFQHFRISEFQHFRVSGLLNEASSKAKLQGFRFRVCGMGCKVCGDVVCCDVLGFRVSGLLTGASAKGSFMFQSFKFQGSWIPRYGLVVISFFYLWVKAGFKFQACSPEL